MIIIVGLGNPGEKFKDTPHNLGFKIIDAFCGENNFPDFSFSKKFQAEISEKKINNEKVLLVKPLTFMNSSGKAVASLVKFYKVKKIENLWVVHDDADIALGKFKISRGRGSAGHKGVDSIIKNLKTKSFTRFRIGIQGKNHNKIPKNLDKFVLKKFKKEDREIITKVIPKIIATLKKAIVDGLEKTITEYNR